MSKYIGIDLDEPVIRTGEGALWWSCEKPRLERHPDGRVQLVIGIHSDTSAEVFAEYMGVKILCSPCADVAARMDRLEAQLRGKVL